MKIEELNNAKRISFSIEMIKRYEIVIDKELNKIFQNNVDVTQECLDIMDECSLGNMIAGAAYKGGMVVARILQGKADKGCLNYLKSVANGIMLE